MADDVKARIHNWAVPAILTALVSGVVWSGSVFVNSDDTLRETRRISREEVAPLRSASRSADTLLSILEVTLDEVLVRVERAGELVPDLEDRPTTRKLDEQRRRAREIAESLAVETAADSAELSSMQVLSLTAGDAFVLNSMLSLLSAERRKHEELAAAVTPTRTSAAHAAGVERYQRAIHEFKIRLVGLRAATGAARGAAAARSSLADQVNKSMADEVRKVRWRMVIAGLVFLLSSFSLLAAFRYTLPRREKLEGG